MTTLRSSLQGLARAFAVERDVILEIASYVYTVGSLR